MKQQTLAVAADQTFENYRKSTRRDAFLKTMDAIVPWAALCEVINPVYPRQAMVAHVFARGWSMHPAGQRR